MNLEKFDIQDIEIVDGTSIMSLGDIKTSSLHQLTFSNVFSSSLLDPTNYLINLERYAAGGNASFVMSDFQIDNWRATSFILSNALQFNIESQIFKISNSSFKNMDFNSNEDLIMFESIRSETPYLITLEYLNFENISFKRNGNLLLLRNQQNDFLEINHSSFKNITNGGITVKSFNTLVSTTFKTKVKFNNITTNSINAQDTRFITLEEGAKVEVYNSTFETISSLRVGAVFYLGYRQAEASIYDCTFRNNTAYEGAVFNTNFESNLNCIRCQIYENIAPENWVIKWDENGQFNFVESNIYNNYAYKGPVAEIFSTQLTSNITNCTISNNLILSKEEIMTKVKGLGKL